MSDHIAALEAALENANRHFAHVTVWKNELRDGLDEVKRLREELAAAEARADMHADLGRRTAEALGIPLEEGRADMPEVAARLRAENEALKLAEEGAAEAFGVVVQEKRDALSECARLRELLGAAHEQIRRMARSDIKAAQAAKERT
jgi:hypothetical protein